MSGQEKLLLQLNMPAIRAEERLHERGHELTPKGLYEVIKIISGSIPEAEKAAARLAQRFLKEKRSFEPYGEPSRPGQAR